MCNNNSRKPSSPKTVGKEWVSQDKFRCDAIDDGLYLPGDRRHNNTYQKACGICTKKAAERGLTEAWAEGYNVPVRLRLEEFAAVDIISCDAE